MYSIMYTCISFIILFRELLNCESTLASIYCRSALLCLHSLSSSLPFPLHFTLLSQHYFSQPLVEGVCLSTSPSLSPSLSRCLLSSTPSLFYSDPRLLERELLSWLRGHSGDVLPLVAKLNEEVSIVGGGNGRGEYLIPEGREAIDVHCPGAAFMVIASAHVKPGNKIR